MKFANSVLRVFRNSPVSHTPVKGRKSRLKARLFSRLVPLWAALFLLSGCVPLAMLPAVAPSLAAQTQVVFTPLAVTAQCTDSFIAHELDHTTDGGQKVIALYESNGAGLAINDLDNDGDLDIVLANLNQPNTILWNEGDLSFRTQRLDFGDSRAVSLVDVDGDGWLDVVFTRRFAKPTWLHNNGQAAAADESGRFVAGDLPDVNNPFYAMDWADVDGDGDLDLVAGSYDTEIRKKEGGIFDYRGGGPGVFVYQRVGEGYASARLAEQADALTIVLTDLNGDGRPDILVGNDFDRPDYTWLATRSGWATAHPFDAITTNTMSFDVGDVDNDGSAEIFATDMTPYSHDEATIAAWQPLMRMMTHPPEGDPQGMTNVLQSRDAAGRFVDDAGISALAATGWSWSSKFGDLNNDGFLDIYVVNGMIAEGMLSHLPNDELVEENQALRNDGQGGFEPAPEWGLGSTASGRGMTMADLDGDGDLDIVVNNLRSPAQLFENDLCGGAGLAVDLRSTLDKNSHAIGAQVTLRTSIGILQRKVRANSGYLSGEPSRLHFGLPADAAIERMVIRWPDGAVSDVGALETGVLVIVTR